MKEITLRFDRKGGSWPSVKLSVGQPYRIVLSRARGRAKVLDYEDKLFRTDSAVVLPEGEAPTDKPGQMPRLSAVGLIAKTLGHLKQCNEGCASPAEMTKILMAGHTDTAGNLAYNAKLSAWRA